MTTSGSDLPSAALLKNKVEIKIRLYRNNVLSSANVVAKLSSQKLLTPQVVVYEFSVINNLYNCIILFKYACFHYIHIYFITIFLKNGMF